MFKNFLRTFSTKKSKKEIAPFIEFLRAGTDREMGDMLAATSLCRHNLKISNTISRPFPDAALFGHVPVNEEVAGELSRYNIELIAFRKKLIANHGSAAGAYVSGLNVLIFSFRALSLAQLFATGRTMWSELVRGATYYPEALANLHEDFTQDDAQALWIVPNVLAPEA